MLILYGAMAGVSVVRLYAAALFPGFMLAGLYIIYVVGRAILNPALAPKLPADQRVASFGVLVYSLLTSFFPLAILILSVLGAILFGLATPHEAAGIGALGSLVLAAAYRQFAWTKLKASVFLTARATAMVCWLFVGSWGFASVFALLGGARLIAEWQSGRQSCRERVCQYV